MRNKLHTLFPALLFIIFTFFGISSRAQLILDSTFSQDGMRIDTNAFTAPYPVYYQKIIELPDGSYIGGARRGIHKILINGEKDLTFGSGGSANFPVISGYDYDGVPCVRSLACQRDGKIVVLAQVRLTLLCV